VPESTVTPHTRLELFPITTQTVAVNGLSELTIASHSLNQLADRYGTPLYIYDQATLDNCRSSYSQSLSRYYHGSSGITYAGKAFLCLAMAQWAAQHKVALDCSSAGELYVATQAGIPRDLIIAHGVNKSPTDLQAATQQPLPGNNKITFHSISRHLAAIETRCDGADSQPCANRTMG
jgi:diaminopimelate decarboxylase